MAERRGIRRKQLLDDLKEKRGSCKQKEEALDRTPWRNSFGKVYGLVVKETTAWMKKMWTCKTKWRPTPPHPPLGTGKVFIIRSTWLLIWNNVRYHEYLRNCTCTCYGQRDFCICFCKWFKQISNKDEYRYARHVFCRLFILHTSGQQFCTLATENLSVTPNKLWTWSEMRRKLGSFLPKLPVNGRTQTSNQQVSLSVAVF